MMKIYYLNGPKAGESFELTGPSVTIGRETDNSIQLLVGGVSRYHAKLDFNGSDWILRDLGSTNGTKLNEQNIHAPVTLHDGDRILIGDQTFRVEAEKTASDATPAPAASGAQSVQKPKKETANGLHFVFRAEDETLQPGVSAPPPETPYAGKDLSVQQEPVIPDGNIFRGNTPEPIPENIFSSDAPEKPGKGKSPLKGNLIFGAALLVILLAAGLLIAGMMERDRRNELTPPRAAAAGKEKLLNPFFFFFERQRISPENGNIFKFKVRGELMEVTGKNGKKEKRFLIAVALDDLENGRHFVKTFGLEDPVPQEKVEQFRKDLVDAGFMDINQDNIALPAGNPNYDRMMAGFGDKLKEVVFYDRTGDNNNYFKDVSRKLDFFLADVCQLPSIMKTRKEILEEADHAFTSAGNAYDDYENNNNPFSLQTAIRSYELAENLYGQFRPLPEEHGIAATRLAGLRKALADNYTEGKTKVTKLWQTGEYKEAIAECAKRMKFFTEGSKEYEEFREEKIKLETKLRKRMKGK